MKRGLLCLLSSALLVCAQSDTTRVDKKASPETKRIQAATVAFDEIMSAKDGGIAQDILEKSQCIGIVPNLKRAAFVFGAQYGRGIVTCRIDGTNRWSAPAMIAVQGGSIGLQAGAAEADVVFAVMSKTGTDKLLADKFSIGANVTGAAGPIGREVTAQTDATMRAEVLSWSRARGVFAGLSLDGASVHADNDADYGLYGRDVSWHSILDGHVAHPPDANPLLTRLSRYAPKQKPTGGE